MEQEARLTAAALLQDRAEKNGKRLLIDRKQWEIAEREPLIRAAEQWIRQGDDDRFQPKVRDAVFRIAGTGGLGIHRYLLLTDAEGEPPRLVDVKEACPPCGLPYVRASQPDWADEADRIVWVMKHLQHESPALLSTFSFDGRWYYVKTLQPRESTTDGILDRHQDPDDRMRLAKDMGRVTAAAHLRGTGRKRAATADELVAATADPAWMDRVMDLAAGYSRQAVADFQEFAASDAGRSR